MEAALCRRLWEILEGTRDYLSHETALSILGCADRLPPTLTIVSSGRRRSRRCEEHDLAFVHHPATRHREVISLETGGHILRVSSLEQTLVDLVTDLHLPGLRENQAYWFADLPYHLPRLIELARFAGETPLRRVLFWTLHAGRACWGDIPDDLTASPVKLFPAGDSTSGSRAMAPHSKESGPPSPAGESPVWESRLRMFFPREVLGCRSQSAPWSGNPQVQEWREFLCKPSFQAWQVERGWLPIRNDPRPAQRQELERFFRQESDRAIREKPGALLAALCAHHLGEPPTTEFSPLILSWISSQDELLASWEAAVLSEARKLLRSADPRRFEAGLYHIQRLGRLDEALKVITTRGATLFQAGRLQVFAMVCRSAVASGRLLPSTVRNLYARVLGRFFQHDEALAAAGRGRGDAGKDVPGPLEKGDLAYTAGVIHLESGAYAEAQKELTKARRRYSTAGDTLRNGKVLIALGNLDVARGRYADARRWYLKGIALLRDDTSEDLLAMLYNNLGYVEFRTGRFHRATRLLTKARAQYHTRGNPLVEATSLVTQGRATISTGNVPRAFGLFRKAHAIQNRNPGSGCPEETAALLAWSCDLQGLHAVSGPWWKRAGEATSWPHTVQAQHCGALRNPGAPPPKAAATILTVRIMSALLAGHPEAARPLLEAIANLGKSLSLPPDEIAFHRYLHGMVEFCAGSGKAFALFRSTLESFVPTANPSLDHLIMLMGLLSAPSTALRASTGNVLQRLEADRLFDPLWPVYADRLSEFRIPQARSFLSAQAENTPLGLLSAFANRFPGAKRILQRVSRERRHDASLTIIRNGLSQACSPALRLKWLTMENPGSLLFDKPTGKLRFHGKEASLRPGSYPHGLLTQLLAAFPKALPRSDLYRSVWGGDYDAECDAAGWKAAFTRLRATLRKLSPRIRLLRGEHPPDDETLTLEMGCSWECII